MLLSSQISASLLSIIVSHDFKPPPPSSTPLMTDDGTSLILAEPWNTYLYVSLINVYNNFLNFNYIKMYISYSVSVEAK